MHVLATGDSEKIAQFVYFHNRNNCIINVSFYASQFPLCSRAEVIMVDRFSSLKLRGGKVLRNRLVVPPMASGTADAAGFVTEATLAHYARLGQADPGL